MNPLAKALAMYKRLAAAIDRHGLERVAEMILITVQRRGLRATVQLGAIQRPFTHRLGQAVRAPAAKDAAAKAPASDLDADYMLAEAAWPPWRDVVGAAETPSGAEPAALAFLIAPGEPQALAATRAAVAALGPGAEMLDPKEPLARASCDRFVVFLKAGDIPAQGLAQAIGQAAEGGVAEVVSFDLVRREGERVQPLLLPGANPTLLKAADYLFSRLALRGSALPAEPMGAPDPRELVLRWLDGRPGPQARGRWRHVGQPLVMAAVSGEDIEAQRQAAFAHGRRPARPVREPVSVVLCTRDKGHLTRQVVRRLLDMDPGAVAEVVIVSNGTANPYALRTLADLSAEPRVKVIKRDEPFNFSRLSNAGVRAGEGKGPLLFLNDDIAPVTDDWLERLSAWFDDPHVGAAGPLLLYPDERVQHAGMYLGHRGVAGHTLRAARLPQDDYLLTGCAPREVSSLTGAVLLTPRPLFEALNGFDEQLATHLQDVDYCLRLRAIGRINVFDPASILIHMESASVGSLLANKDFLRGRPAERERFIARWGSLLSHDPLHPAGFDMDDETLRTLAGPGRRRPVLPLRR